MHCTRRYEDPSFPGLSICDCSVSSIVSITTRMISSLRPRAKLSRPRRSLAASTSPLKVIPVKSALIKPMISAAVSRLIGSDIAELCCLDRVERRMPRYSRPECWYCQQTTNGLVSFNTTPTVPAGINGRLSDEFIDCFERKPGASGLNDSKIGKSLVRRMQFAISSSLTRS